MNKKNSLWFKNTEEYWKVFDWFIILKIITSPLYYLKKEKCSINSLMQMKKHSFHWALLFFLLFSLIRYTYSILI